MLLKNIYTIGKKFFFSKETRIKAIGLFTLAILFQLGLIYGSVKLNKWNGDFFNNLQAYNYNAIVQNIKEFCIIVFFLILAFVIKYVSQSYLVVYWRQSLTHEYIDQWLEKKSYLANNLLEHKVDNPDQRISQDILNFCEASIGLFFTFLDAILTLCTFSFILWNLSGSLKFSLYNHNFVIHGYIFWAVTIYCVLGTIITFKIGEKLTQINYEQEKKEANLRFNLMRIRENSNAISLYQGEHFEKISLKNILSYAIENSFQMIKLTRNIGIWRNLYNNFSLIFPFLVALPKLLAKEFQFGTLMQIAQAFGNVKDALSVLVDNFYTIASYRAVVQRLTDHDQQIKLWQDTLANNKISIDYANRNFIEVKNLMLTTPSGKILQKKLNFIFEAEQSYLIKGSNGCGKSTFISALAGFWFYGQGKVLLPQINEIFFLPQKTFMHNNNSLISELCYPSSQLLLDRSQAVEYLNALNMPQLIERLDNIEDWPSSLSLGEQQKIAFIRAIIHQPKFLIMDESTSALNPNDERIAFEYLRLKLPRTCIISVGHRESIKKFHNIEINFDPLSA
jgi:vitamin B12/bleomycin/antimicrobial peptide transport system ATP-binding/permease protein